MFIIINQWATLCEACCINSWDSTWEYFCQPIAFWKQWWIYGVWQEWAYFKEWGKSNCSTTIEEGSRIIAFGEMHCWFFEYKFWFGLVLQARGYKTLVMTGDGATDLEVRRDIWSSKCKLRRFFFLLKYLMLNSHDYLLLANPS